MGVAFERPFVSVELQQDGLRDIIGIRRTFHIAESYTEHGIHMLFCKRRELLVREHDVFSLKALHYEYAWKNEIVSTRVVFSYSFCIILQGMASRICITSLDALIQLLDHLSWQTGLYFDRYIRNIGISKKLQAIISLLSSLAKRL